eukprot:469739-Lingulodinium_polyedra.AAC.1
MDTWIHNDTWIHGYTMVHGYTPHNTPDIRCGRLRSGLLQLVGLGPLSSDPVQAPLLDIDNVAVLVLALHKLALRQQVCGLLDAMDHLELAPGELLLLSD